MQLASMNLQAAKRVLKSSLFFKNILENYNFFHFSPSRTVRSILRSSPNNAQRSLRAAMIEKDEKRIQFAESQNQEFKVCKNPKKVMKKVLMGKCM